MNVLMTYIVKEVLKGSFLALLLLLTLFNLFTFSDELKDLGKGSYQLKEIFLYLALTSPRVLYELIPSSALLGSLFVIGAMANNREIVAMRAAGLSVFWIIKAVMTAGVILVIFAFMIGEFVAPDAERHAQLIKTHAQNQKIAMRSRYGLWLREDNKFINVRTINNKTQLTDVFIYELNPNRQLENSIHAKHATFLGNERWRMNNVSITELSKNQLFSAHKEKIEWETSIEPDLLDVVVIKSENMALYDLFTYIEFLKGNNQKYQSFELAFWSRLVNPFITFVMLMVSIPFVVSINRTTGTGGRMMLGIIIGMGFNIFDKIAGHLGLVYGYNPLLMAVLPSLLVLSGAVIAIRRVH